MLAKPIIEAGADLNKKDNSGQTALGYARQTYDPNSRFEYRLIKELEKAKTGKL